MQSESLSKKVVQGSFWIFSLRIGERLLGLVRLIVVARLLSPNDFGLLGIAALITSCLNVFFESGFDQALIHKQEQVEEFLNTAWTVQVLRGGLLFAMVFFAAPFTARFFQEPGAIIIIQVFAFTQIIDGLRNIGTIYFRKEIEFKKQFFLSFLPEVIALIVTIITAFILRSVWALVIGAITCSLFIVIFSYLLHSYRPKFEWNLAKMKNLMRFGKWVLGYGILGFLIIQGDDIFVGRILGATALGLYQMAYRISNLPATQISHVISQVTFPAYAKFQNNIKRLSEAYLRVLEIVAFISFPLAGLIFTLSHSFTTIFLGEKWLEMVPAMQALCIFGLARSLSATTGPVFVGVGKPKIMVKLSSIQLIFLIIIIYPLTKQWGIMGTAIATVIPNLITPVLAGIDVVRITKCRVSNFLKPIIIPFSYTMGVLFITNYIFNYNFGSKILIFISTLIFYVICYLSIAYIFRNILNYNPLENIEKLLKRNFEQ
ncbi:MAG: lipopolysaccharide biosynthesis protein [Candidatus Omnitrophota bacterium]